MTRVLLTGFDPFEGERVNPSWQAVSAVAAAPPDGCAVEAVRLPCVFGAALDALRAAVERADPDIVVCVGQAGGRADLTVERVAVNVDDARTPDNAGRQPVDTPVIEGGPVAYFAALPVKACVAAARAAGVPASVSQTAGTFVCNHVFYGLMHLIATERPSLRGGFVHIPYTTEQVLDRAVPSLSVTLAAEGLRAVVGSAVSRVEDIVMAGGATH
ncbi:pyroglutamyl-peptidase I [Streptantibioticus ferralitis]|uniref:Pyrrolidone-carboxylate peptidase n=1 Tax=Streptantibioticus ferralitis TaxID=236510 RepID=A0ABT5YXQ1_9ACTN|nr:pyroglutamyl-peptidase I [Streptantibioticus ferralitis]MDF2256258.1 pyroglutamyl-peptidase I [Streptantibioticus ferralitis]